MAKLDADTTSSDDIDLTCDEVLPPEPVEESEFEREFRYEKKLTGHGTMAQELLFHSASESMLNNVDDLEPVSDQERPKSLPLAIASPQVTVAAFVQHAAPGQVVAMPAATGMTGSMPVQQFTLFSPAPRQAVPAATCPLPMHVQQWSAAPVTVAASQMVFRPIVAATPASTAGIPLAPIPYQLSPLQPQPFRYSFHQQPDPGAE
ncbi:uncharacterized protein LOC135804465 isoform X2 [Sycon ciliatum]